MKQIYKLLRVGALCLGTALVALAQPRVNNVRIALNYEGKQIEISYDVFGIQEADSIYLSITGKQAGTLMARSLSGDIGRGIKPGRGHKIFWDVMADNLKIDDELVAQIFVAVAAPPPVLAQADSLKQKPPKVKNEKTARSLNGGALLTLGAGLAAGAGLYFLGMQKQAQSVDSYELYKIRNWNHRDDLTFTGSDPDLQNTFNVSLDFTRADYKKAQRQLFMSRALKIGGIALAVADAFLTIPNLVKTRPKKVGLHLDMDAYGIAQAGIKVRF